MPSCPQHGLEYPAGGSCLRCPGRTARAFESWFAWVCLTVGQVVSVAVCVACLMAAVWAVGVMCDLWPGGAAAANPGSQPQPQPSPTHSDYNGWVLIGGVLGFFHSAGMYFVFDRAKRGSP